MGFWRRKNRTRNLFLPPSEAKEKGKGKGAVRARNRLTNAKRPKQAEIVSKELLLPSEIAFRPEPPQGRSAAFEEMGLGETRGHNPAPLNPTK